MSDRQKKFMRLCKQSVTGVDFSQILLYKELIREELVGEFFPALDEFLKDPLNKNNIREVLDGMGDTLVVVSAIAFSMGVNPEAIKERIDVSNLTKCIDGKIIKRADGKILKPDTFKKADFYKVRMEYKHA